MHFKRKKLKSCQKNNPKLNFWESQTKLKEHPYIIARMYHGLMNRFWTWTNQKKDLIKLASLGCLYRDLFPVRSKERAYFDIMSQSITSWTIANTVWPKPLKGFHIKKGAPEKAFKLLEIEPLTLNEISISLNQSLKSGTWTS